MKKRGDKRYRGGTGAARVSAARALLTGRAHCEQLRVRIRDPTEAETDGDNSAVTKFFC